MALQSSGPIKISEINAELGSTSYSLRTLSLEAGKSSPDAMSEFYGYSAGTSGYSYTTSTISFPSISGYTLYTGGWEYAGSYTAAPDDDFTATAITLGTSFYIDGAGSTSLYISSNGYITVGSGLDNIETNTDTYGIGGYWYDLRIYEGDPIGVNTQGVWYNVGSDSNGNYVKLIVHCVTYGDEYDASYMINWYRDSNYQYVVTRLLTSDPIGDVYTGPYLLSPEVSSTTSKVFRSSLTGTSWTYLGTGNVV